MFDKPLETYFFYLIFQLSHLELTKIDGEETEELPICTEEELAELSKDEIQYKITVLEEELSQMKPNMAAIAEYRKKVRY